MAEFVPYDDNKHRAQFLELNVDYLDWGRIEYLRYGIEFFRDRNAVREYVENAIPKFVEAKPPQSILYILEVDGKAVGMGALMKLGEGVAELKRMYIRPEYRGYGYGRKMLDKLTETARARASQDKRLLNEYCVRIRRPSSLNIQLKENNLVLLSIKDRRTTQKNDLRCMKNVCSSQLRLVWK